MFAFRVLRPSSDVRCNACRCCRWTVNLRANDLQFRRLPLFQSHQTARLQFGVDCGTRSRTLLQVIGQIGKRFLGQPIFDRKDELGVFGFTWQTNTYVLIYSLVSQARCLARGLPAESKGLGLQDGRHSLRGSDHPGGIHKGPDTDQARTSA